MISRRQLIIGAAVSAAAPCLADTLPLIIVYKDTSCDCCSAWVDHVRGAGFTVAVKETSDLVPVKRSLGVPDALWSCHTAEVGGYVLEGHVPAAEIKLLLSKRPLAKGLAAPGMPVGSPGMEVTGTKSETYAVILFGAEAPVTFARYAGSTRL
jgi:hypothetical protein